MIGFLTAVDKAYLSLCTLDWIVYFNDHEEDAGERKSDEARYAWLKRAAVQRIEGIGLHMSLGSINLKELFEFIPKVFEELCKFILNMIDKHRERTPHKIEVERLARANTQEKIDWIKQSNSFTSEEKKLMEKELILDPLCNVATTYDKVKVNIRSAELTRE